jgi:hypothetical protein
MRRLLILCFLLLDRCWAAPGPNLPIWKPPAAPDACSMFRVELILLDVSKSMARNGFFDEVRNSAARSIDAAPPCDLMILGTFGVTADIRAAEFLSDSRSREAIKAALRRLRPLSAATNLDEAAKAIELLTYQLRDAYGSRFGVLLVTAYTDDVPAPSPGKEPFSLAGYLARRLDAMHVQVADSDSRLPPPPSDIRRIILEPSQSKSPGAVRPLPMAGSNMLRAAFLCAGAALVLGVVIAVDRRVRRSRRPASANGILSGLAITEMEQALPDGQPQVLSRDFQLAAASGLPVVFSTDPYRGAYVVAPGEGIPAGELFCLFPNDDGTVRVEGAPGVTAAARPVGEKGATIDARDGVLIAYGKRSFRVRLLFDGIRAAGPLWRTA